MVQSFERSITWSDWCTSRCAEEALWTKWGIVGILNHWEHNEQTLVRKRWRNGFSKAVNYVVCLHSRVCSPGPTSRKKVLVKSVTQNWLLKLRLSPQWRGRNWCPTSSLLQAMCIIVVINSSNRSNNSKSWKRFKKEIKFYFEKIPWSSMSTASSCCFALDVGLEFVNCFLLPQEELHSPSTLRLLFLFSFQDWC